MMRLLFTLVVCIGSAFLGQVVFGHIPVVNWVMGALTGMYISFEER